MVHMQLNQEKPTYPTDYLDQIAPRPSKRGFSLTRKQLVIAGGIGLLVLFSIFAIVIKTSTGNTKAVQQLSARLQTTAEIVSNSHQSIKNSQLRSLNSNLNVFLTNANRDATKLLADSNIKRIDQNIATIEKNDGSKLAQTLEDARLNAVFDRTYAREMAYHLETIMALMQQINSNTKSPQWKSFLDDSLINLKPIQKELAEFNATES